MSTIVGTVVATRWAIAALIGLAAGLEREWSGHASGSDARFAGVRTFTLLGIIGGVSGTFAVAQYPLLAAATAATAGALCVAGYLAATRRDGSTTDGTTETAALLVIALGIVCGVGAMGVAAGAGGVLVLLLREKERVHWFVRQLDEPALRGGVQFAALAVVVLPLLPEGPYFGALAVEPRMLWEVVLLFCGLNFAGFIARRTVGANNGLTILGAIGGMISSTAVTLDFARKSRTSDVSRSALASGAIAASTVLVPRVLTVTTILNVAVAARLAPVLTPMFIVGVATTLLIRRHDTSTPPSMREGDEESPLRFTAALRMALLFEGAMLCLAYARRFETRLSLVASGAFLGLTDVDALTVSASRPGAMLSTADATRLIVAGIIANSMLKLLIAAIIGRDAFRRRAVAGLGLLAGAGVLGFFLV